MKEILGKALGPVELVLAILIVLGLTSRVALEFWQGQGPVDEKRIIISAKDAVLKDLRKGDFLKKEIERGIEQYVQRQKQARFAARAAKRRMANERAKNVRPVSSQRDHIYGNPNAAISLIEYSDFECPFCKRFHPMAKKIVAAYGGKANWVYRHFPLKIHNPGAQKEAEASECANELGGKKAFWKYTNAIYARTRSNGRGFPLRDLRPLAKEIGIDGPRFEECLNSGKHAGRVLEDFHEGRRIGILGTPTTIILNNKTGEARFRAGVLPLTAFKNDIEMMLRRTPTAKAWR